MTPLTNESLWIAVSLPAAISYGESRVFGRMPRTMENNLSIDVEYLSAGRSGTEARCADKNCLNAVSDIIFPKQLFRTNIITLAI